MGLVATWAERATRYGLARVGSAVDKLQNDSKAFDQLIGYAHRSIPIPIRWFVRRKRLAAALQHALLNRALVRNHSEAAVPAQSPTSHAETEL